MVWLAIDKQSAAAAHTDADITTKLRFEVCADGLIDTVFAEKRRRLAGKQMTYAPWRGRDSNYAKRSNTVVPLHGEAIWLMPEEHKPYNRSLTVAANHVSEKLIHQRQ